VSLVQFTEAQLDKLRAVSPQLDIHQYPHTPPADLPPDLQPQVDILYGWGKPAGHIETLPRLKWLQAHSAGVDYLADTPLWQNDEIIVTSLNGIHAVPMAEHALAMMLAFRWKLPAMLAYQRQGTWVENRWEAFAGPELRGQTIGIVGYGAVGREVARQAGALGMRVLAVNSTGQRQPARGYSEPGVGDPEAALPERIYPSRRLLEMLPLCDYVVVLAPLTPQTHYLIGAGALVAMKTSAILINLARGPLVDETALIESLREGEIAGAALDVFEQEPLPVDSPLWRMPNVIVSPHVSGFTYLYDERASRLFAENLDRYIRHQPLLNLVDKERGY
jgi:phosphoglycerate dehydrogenase-like enzyme